MYYYLSSTLVEAPQKIRNPEMIKEAKERNNVRMIVFGVIGITVLFCFGIFVMKFFILDSVNHTVMSICKVTTCEIWSCSNSSGRVSICNLTRLQYQTMIINSNVPKQFLIGNTTLSHLDEIDDDGCDPNINATQCKFVIECTNEITSIICYYHDLYPLDTINIKKPLMPIYGIWTFVSLCIIMSILIVVTGTLICNSYSYSRPISLSQSIKMQSKMQSKKTDEMTEPMNLLDFSDDNGESINLVNNAFTDEHL